MALDFSYYEMAEVDDEAGNNPTFTAVPGNCTSSAMPLVTSKLLELASPPTVTPGDSDDGITTGGSNSSGGSSSGSDDADGGGDDEDDDEDQQMFHRPTAPTYVPPTTIRTRTYHEEVRYRDAIFRPFLMNQDWDRGPDFRLCRDFVSSCRDQDDNVVPNNVITLDRAHDTYPYVWDYEWEVVPGKVMVLHLDDCACDDDCDAVDVIKMMIKMIKMMMCYLFIPLSGIAQSATQPYLYLILALPRPIAFRERRSRDDKRHGRLHYRRD